MVSDSAVPMNEPPAGARDVSTPDRIVSIADVNVVLAAAPPWPAYRPLDLEDLPWLARAAFDALPQPPGATEDEVYRLIQSLFLGERGEFMPLASPVALTADGYIAGAVAVVLRQSAAGAPDCPAVLACVTLPDHAGEGVAEGLLAVAARGVGAVAERRLALALDPPQPEVQALAARLGFVAVPRDRSP